MSMEETQTPGATIVDVTDETFVAEVVEESNLRPVVVDFWAEWCAPCRTLGPILERLAEENGGAFRLAKLDVDTNPAVAAHFMVQGIPAVKAFSGGQLVDEFVGSMPEQVVRNWLTPILPTQADKTASAASREAQSGDLNAAERDFRAALEADSMNREARLGLGKLLSQREEISEARELLSPLSPDPDADRLLAKMRVAEWKGVEGSGTLASAKRLAAVHKWREALDGMLGSLQDEPQVAREAMLDVFVTLGDEDELTREYRGKLASALF